MQINTIQRNLLITASGVLALMLLMDIDSQGLEDSHWIAVTTLIAVLLFVALSSKQKYSVSPKTVITPEILASNKRDEGHLIVKARYNECKSQWEEFLKLSMVDRHSKLSKKDRSDFVPFLEMTAIKLAFATYLLVILHRGPDGQKSEDARILRLYAGGILAHSLQKSYRELMKVLSGMPIPDRSDALRIAGQQLREYEVLVARCEQSFRSRGSFPLDALFTKVDDEAKFGIGNTESREAFFGIKYREETGRLLHPWPGITL